MTNQLWSFPKKKKIHVTTKEVRLEQCWNKRGREGSEEEVKCLAGGNTAVTEEQKANLIDGWVGGEVGGWMSG